MECETHLYFLWDARERSRTESARYKQVAAELRVLVGDHCPDRRLLLALMKETGFAYEVQLPQGPPYGAIPMVGWREDPEFQAQTDEINAAMGDPARLAELLEQENARAHPVPFPEFVDRGLAVYIAPYDYSFRELVLAVSQQIGSAHEDLEVDKPLIQLEQFIINGNAGYVEPLVYFADLVVTIGGHFMAHANEKCEFTPSYFTVA